MSFTLAIILFLLVIFVYLVFIEIFTIIYMITGISESKARFQVISLITNTGFTTEDSELIMNSNLRKGIAKFIMVFSYCFSVSIVALLVNFFMEVGNIHEVNYFLIIGIFTFFAISYILIKNVKFSRKIFYSMIEKLTKKFIYKNNENNIVVIEKIDNKKVFAKIVINMVPYDLIDNTIEKSGIKRKYSIQIISINRNDSSLFPVKASDTVQQGDTMFVVGSLSNISEFATKINSI